MRFIGIDYGTKNIGVALSDGTGGFAFAHSVITNTPRAVIEIVHLARSHDVTEIVIGESRDFKGKENSIMARATDLGKSLTAAGLVVHFEPEFLSSHQAHHIQGKVAKLDASAAAIILQSFLDKKKNTVQ